MLRIYNTLSKTKEDFIPIAKDQVSIYRCGPTVYWTQHIGNMRGMVMSDLIVRTLKYLDYNPIFVRNYTDVGHLTSDGDFGVDKMEKGARREGLTPDEIANKYISQFERDLNQLNVLIPDYKPRASEYIDEMIEMIKILIEKGFAYETSKAVYFDISKFPTYTNLSGQKLEKNIEGEGHGSVSDQENKKNPQDFSLWFFKTGEHKNALQVWKSPFYSKEVSNGLGFPGWHIECSAMARAILGKTIDIHIGGIEHIPVHHTNEIAQSESTNGVKFSNYWVHHEHLDIDGEKMSKSTGNIFSLSDLISKGYSPLELRYFFLQSHYRSKQNFTFEALDASRVALKRIENLLKENLQKTVGLGDLDEELEKRYREYKSDLKDFKINVEYRSRFISSIEDDFNIPKALSLVWDLLREDLQPDDKIATILNFDYVFGLNLETLLFEPRELNPEIKKILLERKIARENKNWELSDHLRDRLQNEFNYKVQDR